MAEKLSVERKSGQAGRSITNLPHLHHLLGDEMKEETSEQGLTPLDNRDASPTDADTAAVGEVSQPRLEGESDEDYLVRTCR